MRILLGVTIERKTESTSEVRQWNKQLKVHLLESVRVVREKDHHNADVIIGAALVGHVHHLVTDGLWVVLG